MIIKKSSMSLAVVAACIAGMGIGHADEIQHFNQELEDLKARIDQLEQQQRESTDGEGHKLHPVHSLSGAKLSGGVTGIYQASAGNQAALGGNGSEGQMSADLYLEAPIGEQGSFLFRFDIEQGAGLTKFPPVFTNPDGNTGGPNNDVETWTNSESLNLNEARYEHRLLDDAFKLVIGQIDITSFFDENEYANKETFQYIAQQFNNNPTIDWGGTVNFFGPGIVLVASPREDLDINLGWFEGNGDYKQFFSQPFMIGQLHFKTDFRGREGNYRVYAWERQTPHCTSSADPSQFLNCELIAQVDQVVLKERNRGAGANFDQQLSTSTGIWARVGVQDPDVAQFGKALSVGLITAVAERKQPQDVLGFAYGAAFPGGAYKSVTGYSDTEHYAEIYYKFVLSGDGSTSGFHITPDIQYVVNPAGNGRADSVIVYGLRTQVHF